MPAGDVWGNSWLSSWGFSWRTAVTPPVVSDSPSPGVGRRVRFLRRAPRLPWEQDDQPATADPVVQQKRRRARVQLPKPDPLPDDAQPTQIEARQLRMPALVDVPQPGEVVLDYDDDDEIILLSI